ncbi:UNVERIFIED_CONTAM: hypothetical protein K2H54_053154 [Gekko kuhli]
MPAEQFLAELWLAKCHQFAPFPSLHQRCSRLAWWGDMLCVCVCATGKEEEEAHRAWDLDSQFVVLELRRKLCTDALAFNSLLNVDGSFCELFSSAYEDQERPPSVRLQDELTIKVVQ